MEALLEEGRCVCQQLWHYWPCLLTLIIYLCVSALAGTGA